MHQPRFFRSTLSPSLVPFSSSAPCALGMVLPPSDDRDTIQQTDETDPLLCAACSSPAFIGLLFGIRHKFAALPTGTHWLSSRNQSLRRLNLLLDLTRFYQFSSKTHYCGWPPRLASKSAKRSTSGQVGRSCIFQFARPPSTPPSTSHPPPLHPSFIRLSPIPPSDPAPNVEIFNKGRNSPVESTRQEHFNFRVAFGRRFSCRS